MLSYLWMFSKGCKSHDQEILWLRTQLSDLQDLISRERELAAKERQELLDRFMAVLRPSSTKSGPPSPAHASLRQSSPGFPGSRPDLRPPDPSSVSFAQQRPNVVVGVSNETTTQTSPSLVAELL